MPLWSRKSIRKKSSIDRSTATQINALLLEVVAATVRTSPPTPPALSKRLYTTAQDWDP